MIPRAALTSLAVIAGAIAGAIGGFAVALVFGEALFGWHDNIGPELRFAFLGALIGAVAGYGWAATRADRTAKDMSRD